MRQSAASGLGLPALEPWVTAQLHTLRREHADAAVLTELIQLDETRAVVRARIELPGAGTASAFGIAPATSARAVEEAEDRALSRALSVLGYPIAEPAIVARTPVSSEPGQAQSQPVDPERHEPTLEVNPVTPEPPPTTMAAPEDESDPPMEDYSWTSFWIWARSQGYQNKAVVEDLIGQSITSLNPIQVRDALRARLPPDEAAR